MVLRLYFCNIKERNYRMRVGIVINTSWNVYNFRLPLVKALINNGHQVVAITPYDESVENLLRTGCEHRHIIMQNKSASPWSDLNLLRRYIKLFKDEQFDVILSYTIKPNIYATIAASYCRIPVVVNITGLGTVFLRKYSLASIFGRLGLRMALPLASKVFFQNPDDHARLTSGFFVSKKKTEILYGSGIDLSEFKPMPAPENEVFTFLMIARALYDKGIREYIQAIRLLKSGGHKLRFQFLGAVEPQNGLGVDIDTIIRWQSEGLIEYYPHTKDVRPFIAQADCVVLPSYREGTPRTLIEAASMAKPIVTTNVPGCRETVNGENGLLCRVKSAEDLADKMLKISQLSKETLKKMGAASRKLAETKFDVRNHISRYFLAIEECTGQNPSRNLLCTEPVYLH